MDVYPEIWDALTSVLRTEEEREKRNQMLLPPLYEAIHCGQSMFKLESIDHCLLCGSTIPHSPEVRREHYSRIAPSQPRCLVIRTTIGSFLQYRKEMLLHCGISDSTGRKIYNFDERGCNVDIDQWTACLNIPISCPRLLKSEWDAELERHHEAETTFEQFRKYHQLENNCYDYVIRFLNAIRFEDNESHTKGDIVQRFIQTPVDKFEAYYSIYERVRARGSYVGAFPEKPPPLQHLCDACNNQIEWKANRYRCTVCMDYDLCEKCHREGRETGEHKEWHEMYKTVELAARYSCDVCRETIGPGERFHCTICEDYDLCGKCKREGKISGRHKSDHVVIRL